jgi:hypothetical protein
MRMGTREWKELPWSNKRAAKEKGNREFGMPKAKTSKNDADDKTRREWAYIDIELPEGQILTDGKNIALSCWRGKKGTALVELNSTLFGRVNKREETGAAALLWVDDVHFGDGWNEWKEDEVEYGWKMKKWMSEWKSKIPWEERCKSREKQPRMECIGQRVAIYGRKWECEGIGIDTTDVKKSVNC